MVDECVHRSIRDELLAQAPSDFMVAWADNRSAGHVSFLEKAMLRNNLTPGTSNAGYGYQAFCRDDLRRTYEVTSGNVDPGSGALVHEAYSEGH
jgi:hypothetical protein